MIAVAKWLKIRVLSMKVPGLNPGNSFKTFFVHFVSVNLDP